MKFIISVGEFNALISKMQNVVLLKPTIPVIGNFLIEAYNDELTVTATDLTMGICCHKEAKILEEGTTTLPARRLVQLIRELPPTLNVEVSSTPNEITTLVAGNSRFKLNGMSKNEFPALPDLSHTHSFQIKQKELKDLLYRTAFTVSREDNRYVLTGVLMHIANGQVTFVGTDGKRLSRAQAAIAIDLSFTSQSIIPLKAVEEILKNLSDEGEAKLSLTADKLSVEVEGTRLLTKLLSGDYPDINRVIPDSCETTICLHREELTTLLRQVSLFTEQHHSSRFTFSDGELKLSANTKDIGEGHVSMPVNYHGPKLDIAFNPSFFLDILRHCREETVTIGLTDPYNPGVITDREQLSQPHLVSPLFVIMPMRLSED